MGVMDPDLRTAYLARLGLDPEPPSAEALQLLHRFHAELVPYETLWIHAGEAWDIDPMRAAARIALEGRGGYCYHLNGAFAELLESLGYRVARHVGGVHGPDGPSADSMGNHLVLTVSDLPAPGNPSGNWYVDVGLGDALHDPMPLAPGVHRQGPFRLQLSEPGDGTGDWHLEHDPAGGFAGMSWLAAEAASPSDEQLFADKHGWLSTSPDSGFVRLGLAQTRDATGVDVVRGLMPIRIGSDAHVGSPLTERREWFDALGDLFGLYFRASPPELLDRLWARMLGTHRAWEQQQG
jgi:N-hydroxyarylamine O-acetyltransferase